MVDIQELYTKKSSGYYSESAKIFVSHDSKYYDEIAKAYIQTREEYKYTSQCGLNQKIQKEEQEELHNQTRRKRRILVVDDEPDVCMVYQIVLEDAGFECISYIDSVKALQEFRPAYYDLILLDIKMPVLNGFEVCKKIIELDKSVHIVFITASEEYYEKFRRQHFPELGKINYIQKPIGNEELVQIVDMIVANSISIE
ncbi:MAG TPA: response regulator [Nitrososphaeraceae archaeon]|jgi:CheY-like chemotaxis protein|nr:response regulator [Nitrososphaeraceae archaeon]